jgi:hypothetical protein
VVDVPIDTVFRQLRDTEKLGFLSVRSPMSKAAKRRPRKITPTSWDGIPLSISATPRKALSPFRYCSITIISTA